MILSKWYVFIIGIIILISIFFIPRLLWLNNSIQTKARVLYIGYSRHLRTTSQKFPVFEYYTDENRITSAGSYNLPYKPGDTVLIRYNPDDVFDFTVDDFMGNWIARIIWVSPFLFVWILMFLPKDFDFSISLIRGKLTVRFG